MCVWIDRFCNTSNKPTTDVYGKMWALGFVLSSSGLPPDDVAYGTLRVELLDKVGDVIRITAATGEKQGSTLAKTLEMKVKPGQYVILTNMPKATTDTDRVAYNAVGSFKYSETMRIVPVSEGSIHGVTLFPPRMKRTYTCPIKTLYDMAEQNMSQLVPRGSVLALILNEEETNYSIKAPREFTIVSDDIQKEHKVNASQHVTPNVCCSLRCHDVNIMSMHRVVFLHFSLAFQFRSSFFPISFQFLSNFFPISFQFPSNFLPTACAKTFRLLMSCTFSFVCCSCYAYVCVLCLVVPYVLQFCNSIVNALPPQLKVWKSNEYALGKIEQLISQTEAAYLDKAVANAMKMVILRGVYFQLPKGRGKASMILPHSRQVV